MRLRFLLPVRFIGTIRRKVKKKKTISESRPQSQSSLQKIERILSVPELDIELAQVESVGHTDSVVTDSHHLETPIEFQETLNSTSSRRRNASRNQGYSSFASSASGHRIGYRLRRSPKKSKKPKNSFQRKMRILAHLFPLLHETLSIFHDICQAATAVNQRFEIAFRSCPPLAAIILLILMVSSFETILTLILSASVLVLHLLSPKIFKPKCKLRALPRISVRMCFVFQRSVAFAAIGINLVLFRGGPASVTVWVVGLIITYIAQIIGYLNALKLAVIAVLVIKKVAPRHGLNYWRLFEKQLKHTPGIELFQTDRE